jgi:hypothetical protein
MKLRNSSDVQNKNPEIIKITDISKTPEIFVRFLKIPKNC